MILSTFSERLCEVHFSTLTAPRKHGCLLSGWLKMFPLSYLQCLIHFKVTWKTMTVNHCWYSLVVWERVVRKERVRASYIVGDQCNAGSKSGSNASFPSCRAIRMEWGPRRELLPVNRVASGELSSAVSYLQWSKTMFGPTAARIEVMEKGRLGSEKFLVLRTRLVNFWFILY